MSRHLWLPVQSNIDDSQCLDDLNIVSINCKLVWVRAVDRYKRVPAQPKLMIDCTRLCIQTRRTFAAVETPGQKCD
jgi:hypothetical protein